MIDTLSEEQRHMLMEMLLALARTDGRIVSLETEVIGEYAELLEVDLADLSGTLEIVDLAPFFDTPGSKVTVLQELCRLARLDGDFAGSEQQAILDVATAMRVPEAMVAQIDGWVVEGMEWVARGEDLILALEGAIEA